MPELSPGKPPWTRSLASQTIFPDRQDELLENLSLRGWQLLALRCSAPLNVLERAHGANLQPQPNGLFKLRLNFLCAESRGVLLL